jgi:acyl transferase domain-containing protein
VELLASWNIYPSRVVGHSSGEIAAAYCAGKISREGAWTASYYRGHVLSKPKDTKGGMIAVGLDSENLQPYLDNVRDAHKGELVIACYNGPRNNTVSGDIVMIDALKQLLDADDVFARKLKVPDAYHSAHMLPVSGEYLQLMGELPAGEMQPNAQDCRMFSTVTGKEVKDSTLGAEYWVKNMVSPVLFTTALRAMLLQPSESDPTACQSGKGAIDEIVEVGPHSTLQSAIKEIITSSAAGLPISYIPLLSRLDDTIRVTLNAVGSLGAKGYPVSVYEANHNRDDLQPPSLLVNLPHYPFNHEERGYFESRLSKNLRFRPFPRHQLLGAPVQDWDRQNRKWRHFLRISENPWLRDHVVRCDPRARDLFVLMVCSL